MMGKQDDRAGKTDGTTGDAAVSAELPVCTPEERIQWIEKAAYLRAAAREFTGGDPLLDWLEAEAEFDAAIAGESTKVR